MFRSFATYLNAQGYGQIDFSPYVESTEWDIYQIAVATTSQNVQVLVDIKHNGFTLCSSFQGWKDCATGPPDIVVLPSDLLSICFYGVAGDQATVGVWYNENPQGTTYSTAH